MDVRKSGLDWNQYRRLVAEWRRMAPCMLGDYYPVTPYSLKLDQWIAWQFNRPEQGDGVVQAFRRDQCADSSLVCRLCGLDPAAQYEMTNIDVEGSTKVAGQELMERGLTVEIKDQPGAAVITYHRAK
jgi:alpha-galactosidase